MALVDEDTVNAQFLKGDHIVLAALVVQLVDLGLQALLGFLHLFYYEDYSIKEIADILKISESNVKVRLNRGRTVLRDTLKEAWDYEQSE